MVRGTTPTHCFEVDIDTSRIKSLKITYAQKDEEIITKRTEDCEVDGNTISTKLTQEETFLFDSNERVGIQIRVLTHDGDVVNSDIMVASVGKCLDEEVLV